jgi:hypothetical protein
MGATCPTALFSLTGGHCKNATETKTRPEYEILWSITLKKIVLRC